MVASFLLIVFILVPRRALVIAVVEAALAALALDELLQLRDPASLAVQVLLQTVVLLLPLCTQKRDRQA